MAHFAKVVVDADSVYLKVVDIIVAEHDFINGFVGSTPGEWIQTSYNTFGGVHYIRNTDGSLGEPSEDQTKALRYNYAEIGGFYDRVGDAFIPRKFHKSWTLNTNTYTWEAPVPMPNDGEWYVWSEDRHALDPEEGWVPYGDPCCPGT